MRISDWSSDVCSSDLVDRTVGGRGDIALAGVGNEFHVQRRTVVEVADDMVRVHHLDVARHHDVAGLDGRGTGRRKLEPLRAFAFHLERDLLHVEHDVGDVFTHRSEEHTSELQSLMRISYAVFCLKKKNKHTL